MAQWNKDTQSYRSQNTTNFEVVNIATKDGEQISAGNPLPVSIGGESVTITGSVTIPGTIEIANEEGNPIPTHAHLYDESDNEYSASNPITVDGTVTIQDGGNSITVDGNVSATVSGTVSVDNLPATQTVDGTVNIGTMPEVEIKNDANNPIPVTGTIATTAPTGTRCFRSSKSFQSSNSI